MADAEQAYQQYQAEQAYQSYQAQQKPQPTPSIGPWQRYMAANVADEKAAQAEKPQTPAGAAPTAPEAPDHPGQGFLDAIETGWKAGWQNSASGLAINRKLPDAVLPEHAPMAARIVQGATQLAGDLPAMLAGGVMGGAAGTEVPVVGSAAGAAFGAWAMPAAMRRYYVDRLQKGEVTSFGDLFERMASATWDGMKAGTVGAATEGVGELAQSAIGQGAPISQQLLARYGAQLGTMTTVGAAMDDQVPKAQDFVEGALLMAGLHGAIEHVSQMPEYAKTIQTKLQEIYAQTGIKPNDVLQQAAADPVLKQEVLSKDGNVPPSLKDNIESPQKNQELISNNNPDFVKANIPSALDADHPTLSADFKSPNSPQVDRSQQEPEPPKAEEEKPAEGEEQSPREKILSRIGESVEGGPIDRFDSWYARKVDKLNPVAKLVSVLTSGEELPKSQDPTAVLATAKSRGFALANEAIDENFKPIVEKFKDDPNGFKAYGMARRAMELASRGVNVGIDLNASKEYVDQFKGKYEKSFQQLQTLQNNGLQALRDAGFLSKEQHETILAENKAYFPMNVVQEEGSGSGRSATNPIKKIYGSSEQKVDPFEQIVKNQYAYYRMAEENKGKAMLVNLSENSRGESFISRVSAPMTPVKVSPEELNAYLTKYGIHEGDPDQLTIFRPLAQQLGENQFAVMQDGKRSVYESDPSIAKAMNATAYEAPKMIAKVANAFATVQRAAITENPFFLLKHAIRDQFMATIQSQNGYRFGYDGLRGLVHFFAKSDEFMEFLRQGGGMSTVVDFDKKYVRNDIWGLSKETGLLDKTLNVVRTPLDLMRTLAEATFTAPKMGEALRARENGKDAFTAAYEGRKVTADVQQSGSDPFMTAWNAATPFFQMRIRGLDQMVDAFQRDPKGTSAKMALAITLPSIATWWMHHDDDRYKNAPDWEKDMYWLMPMGGKDGPVAKIPKPFEPGLLFGSLVERTLQEFYDQRPDAFKGFGRAMFDDTAPNVIPPVIMPALQQFANRSWLTGGNVVPDSLTKVAPAFQYNNYTTDSAKIIGKALSYVPYINDIGHGNVTVASPMVIESYVRAWTGNVGMYVLQAADKALEAAGVAPPKIKPAWQLADIPFVQSFFARYPSMGAQPIQDFYDNLQKSQTVHNTITHLAKSGDVRALTSYANSDEARENMLNLTGMETAISRQNQIVQQIYGNPEISKDEKSQMIQNLYYQIIQTAVRGNKIMAGMGKKSEGM